MSAPLILQSRLPYKPWMTPRNTRLPGLSPIAIKDWLIQDDAFREQLAYRDQLIRTRQRLVCGRLPQAQDGAEELLETLRTELPKTTGYGLNGTTLTRPDGIIIETGTDTPLLTAGQLAQEDFALLQKSGDTHKFVGGIICFPAHWRLADKLGKSLGQLHGPVDAFNKDISRRTERIFDGLHAETPLERANFLIYTNPDLHQPARAAKTVTRGAARYVRVERQTLRRLPHTGIIVFAIHTYMTPASTLNVEELRCLTALRPELADDAR